MSSDNASAHRRILVIDDTAEIHADFRKILVPPKPASSLEATKAALFGGEMPSTPPEMGPRFSLDSALQGQQGVELARAARARREPYQVAFVDMRMPPGWDGIQTIEQLWRVDHEIQVVICTAYSDHSLEALTERFGRSDKLLVLKKPFEAVEIVQLATALSEKWLTERRVERKVVELEHDLRHDRLTGLPNRLMLSQRLQACIARFAQNPEHRYAVLFLDCDGFKLINDSLGHEIGDMMLICIGERLRESLRISDMVTQPNSVPSRVGGDEFLVLLEDLRETRDCVTVAERLLEVLSQPYEVDGHRLTVSMSIGIATCDQGYENASDAVRDADTAMYRSKAEGGSRYTLFDSAMHEDAKQRLSILGHLREAVRENQIALHYQPIVRLAGGQLVGFEALARWTHPLLGPVAPQHFIAVAEATGLIRRLGENVLRMACHQLADWRARHPDAARDLKMSVNVSRKQIAGEELIACVRAELAETGLEADALVIEVTESLVMHDFDGAAGALRRLRDLGLGIHLDDFGTGYSSLVHLYRLPMAALKIDRAFIADAFTQPSQQRVLEAIVSIAKAFGVTTVAEGIETQEQLELLRGLGVDLGQGFLFGRPTSAEEAERLFTGAAMPGSSTLGDPREPR
jgi:diguanylate cyclase (GGDEF)-like protein